MSIGNVQGIVINEGSGSLAIGNTVKNSNLAAHLIFREYSNYFAAENHTICNHREGIENNSQFGMFLNNKILYNRDNGMILDTNSTGNLVMNNKLICNIPENVVNRGTSKQPYE